jgi:hypothetical protein
VSAADHVGAGRARLGADDPGSGIYGAHRWAGGLLLVDAFRPDRYRRLHLSGEELDTALGVRARALHEAGRLQPDALDLPETWVRAAIVDAVDRWVDLPLDATLLLADRALAAAQLGDSLTAAALYAGARQGLVDLVDSLDGAYDKPVTLLDELRLVLRWAPDGYGVRAPRDASASPFAHTFDALAQEERRRRTRARLYQGKGPGSSEHEPDSDVPVLLHPMHVPARLFDGAPVATAAGDRVDVVVPARAAAGATTPASRRLLVSALDLQTLEVEAVAPVVLDDLTFRSSVRAAARGAAATLVVVHDAAARPVLRFPADVIETARLLTARRDAFGSERMAHAHRAVGDLAGAALALQSRLEALRIDPQTAASVVDLSGPHEVGSELAGAVRPLLAELVLAHP